MYGRYWRASRRTARTTPKRAHGSTGRTRAQTPSTAPNFFPRASFWNFSASESQATHCIRSVFFTDSTRENLSASSRRPRSSKAQPGGHIVRQGELGETLFVVSNGACEVLGDEAPEHALSFLGSGDPFGKIGFLTEGRRTAECDRADAVRGRGAVRGLPARLSQSRADRRGEGPVESLARPGLPTVGDEHAGVSNLRRGVGLRRPRRRTDA